VTRPVVLGLDFGGSKIAVAVAHPGGPQLAADTVVVSQQDSAPQTFDRAVGVAHEMLADFGGAGSVAAVGACTFGIPRPDGVDLAPTIPGWGELAFGNRLRLAFPGAHIRTATDVKAAAQAELTDGALVGCDTGLYLNLGTGLAVAIVVDGRVVHGQHGAAGEIGYNLRYPADGREMSRLEDVVSGQALAAAARDLFGTADVGALFTHWDTDPRAGRVCDQFVQELTYHVVNLAIAIDPTRIAVGGGMVRAWDRLGPPLARALEAAVPFPPELVPAAYPFDAPLRGALALASAAAHPAFAISRESYPEGAPA
jgi:glucokinase